MINFMTLAWGYDEHRDLVTSMTYKRGTTIVAARGYTYDNLGRPITRQTARQGSTVNDTFTYNSRSELIGATVNGKAYGYSYDNIGNRKTAQEDAEESTAYTANQLNQYTAIRQGSGEEGESTESEADTFTPTYDADGNQTRIKTATGIWNVTYNAENRPVRFESADGATVIDCTYDYMGRRHTRKVTVNGTVSNYLRYIYRGYLQISAIDAVSGVFRWFLVWDPTQPEATRPLAIRKDSTWYAYGWDLTKNITEVFGKAGYLRTAYTYTPYGETTATGDVTQPITWSSEYADEELGLIYYNYRHYNPTDGRWINRDPIGEQGGINLYAFVENNALTFYDLFGYVKELDKENEKAVMSCYKVDVLFQRGRSHTEKWKPGKKDIKRAKVGERIFSIIISVFPVYERKSLNGCPCKDIVKTYRKDLPFSIYLKAYISTDTGEEPFYFYPSGLSEKTLIGKRHEQETTLGTILYGGGQYEIIGRQSIRLEPKRKNKPTSLRIVVGSPSINIYNKRHYFDYERIPKFHKK